MSSLTLLPCGETFDYWWERLRGQRFRRRFLLTKAVEVLAYKSARSTNRSKNLGIAKSLLEMQPRIERNEVSSRSATVVVVPARCQTKVDARLLARCAGLLDGQECIVVAVDDGSRVWPTLPAAVQVIRHPSGCGPAAARNTGIRRARELGADLVLFTDADCRPTEDWVAEAKAGFIDNPYIHVQSGNTVSAGETWWDTYHEMNGTLNGRRFRGSDSLFYGPTCNLAVTRNIVDQIAFDGSFSTAACEDIDYCIRALESGFRIVHNKRMCIQHDFRYQRGCFARNVIRFTKQFRKYALAENSLIAKSSGYQSFFRQSTEIPAKLA